MRLWIDADACPVTDIAIAAAKKYHVEIILIFDAAHEIYREGIQSIKVQRGADSVDFALVNLLRSGDIAITQDYGLAAMCLARGGHALNQNGLIYTGENMAGLLEGRHEARKWRMRGGRSKGPAKRSAMQDQAFLQAFEALLTRLTADGDML